MSWQKCVASETYSLAVPAVVVATLNAVHLMLGFTSLVLELPSDCTVLLWLTLFRSCRQTLDFVQRNAGRVFWLDRKGRIYVNETPRNSGIGTAPGELRVLPKITDGARAAGRPGRRETLLHAADHSPVIEGRQHYTCCRSVRVPGCIAITLLKDHGKPLEILVFYRYHQRQFYRRLIRHLAYC